GLDRHLDKKPDVLQRGCTQLVDVVLSVQAGHQGRGDHHLSIGGYLDLQASLRRQIHLGRDWCAQCSVYTVDSARLVIDGGGKAPTAGGSCQDREHGCRYPKKPRDSIRS